MPSAIFHSTFRPPFFSGLLRVVLCCTGVYALNHSTFELLLTALFGGIGYALRSGGFEPAPLLLGFVLSQPFEESLRRALLFSGGDPTTFVTHPVRATLLATAGVLMVLAAVPIVSRARQRLR
jgi:putative tricarboxylic transport membrane protein